MATWSDMLLDPLWQRKRLEIMQRADFRCEECGDSDKTLNVHHGYYKAWGTPPWDYENETLRCLCQPCHKHAHEVWDRIKYLMACLTNEGSRELEGFLLAKILYSRPGTAVVPDIDTLIGVEDFVGVHESLIFPYLTRPEYAISHEIVRDLRRKERKRRQDEWRQQPVHGLLASLV